ncbi:MAG: hypothetical protein JSU96_19980, partial [Acidobacteriota bacterium]
GEPKQFFHSYLVAYLFVVTIAVGALGFVLIQFVTRAGWSVAVRRIAENVMGTIPFFALLFIPLTAGLDQLYPWLDSAHVEHDPILQAKEPYLNGTFFYIRTVIYLVAWSGLAFWFRRQSVAQDQVGGTAITRRLQTVSAPGIVVFAITLTFAAFDWIMSLDPHWYSTVFGVYIFAGAFMSNLAFLLLLVLILQRFGLLTNIVNSEHIHDLGKLMFGFVVFWAYIAFSQFMLIWYANIPEETLWYAHRWHHGWQYASILLAVGHFCFPFFLLLSRSAKRNRGVLVLATIWLLFMHYLDLYWLVMPGFQTEGLHPHVLDLLTFVGIAGLSFALVLQLMMKPSLVPTQDPRLAESLSFENM